MLYFGEPNEEDMNTHDEQPEIPEPQVQVGETIWGDVDGISVGRISAITNDQVIVSYPDRVSSYKKDTVNVAYLPPFLVLVASEEKIIHQY